MTAPHQAGTWRKSSYSGSQTACVEICLETSTARVRDTKLRDAGHLKVSSRAWHALIARLERIV